MKQPQFALWSENFCHNSAEAESCYKVRSVHRQTLADWLMGAFSPSDNLGLVRSVQTERSISAYM